MMGVAGELQADLDILLDLEGLSSLSADQMASLRQVRSRFQANLGRLLGNVGWLSVARQTRLWATWRKDCSSRHITMDHASSLLLPRQTRRPGRSA